MKWKDSSNGLIVTDRKASTRQEVLRLLIALAAAKACLFLAVFLYSRSPDFLYLMSTQWDSLNFQTIAADGYIRIMLYAFSPFYPALIRSLSFVIPQVWICGLIVTNIVSFVFPLLVYRTFDYKTALIAELFPIYLVFTTIPYADVMSLFFLALSIYLILREKIIASSATVSLAIFNSFNLAWTLPSFLVELLKQKRFKNLVFYATPAMVGILLLFYFQIRLGDFGKYFAIERAIWNVRFSNPVSQVIWLLDAGKTWFNNEVYQIFSVRLGTGYWLARNIAFEIFYLFGAFYLLKTGNKNRVFLAAYSLIAIIPLLFMTGTPVLSIPRLLLPAFPVFLSYSTLMKKDWNYLVYSVVCVMSAAFIAIIQTYSFFA